MDSSTVLELLTRHIENNGPVGVSHDPKRGWLVASEWGEEAPDSPMVGAAAYGVGSTFAEALESFLNQTGIKL